MKMKFDVVQMGLTAIVQVQKAVRALAKKEPKLYKEAPNVDSQTLGQAAGIKAQIDVLETQLKALYDDYNPLRGEILASLPGDPIDKVEVLIDGIQLKKYSQTRGFGTLDQEKAIALAKSRKILGKVAERITVVNEDALAVAVVKGLVTQEEYAACLTQGNVAEVLKVERKFQVSADPGANGQAV